MIYAQINYEKHYSEMHDEIVSHLLRFFPELQHGHQGDSWIWVYTNQCKVAIDTFTAMLHQIKSDSDNQVAVAQVISALESNYSVTIFPRPQLEPHEE